MASARKALWPAVVIPLSMILGAGLVILANHLFGGPEPETPVLMPQATDSPVAPEEPAEPPPVTARGDLSDSEETTIEIYRNASDSVVFITKLSVQMDPFRRNAMAIPAGTGSGFVWDDQGHIVTNFHVVAGGQGAHVTLHDQSVWPAQLVGTYPDKDIAVLKIDAPAEALSPLPVGSSANLQVGQHVFAIGNPFGLDQTLSTGVISGLGREIMSLSRRPIQGVIQTDAAINPGNSGGPLLDSAGRLIGMNTAIYSPSGASAGVGFAVPVAAIARAVPQLINSGQVERAGLGIRIDEGQLASRLGLRGALVIGVVPGSGAAEAGLRPTVRDRRTGRIILGDLIVAIDGEAVADVLDLYRVLDGLEVGHDARVTVTRDGSQRTVQVRLTPLQG
ncbi:MAG: trypsin-like peptidase domain-containing protein [Deltaproteobacteria bacterium]|nr:trypsin-like peptidase domain-containing protein [Deltaproteobacteria bacterium]